MSGRPLLKKITALILALVLIMSLSGCSLKRNRTVEESDPAVNSSPAGEMLQRRRASAAENSRTNGTSEQPPISSVKAEEGDFIGKWSDTVSGRCYMDVLEIQDEFLSIVVYWSDSVSDTVYWSLLGEYDSATGEVSYEGMQFRESYLSSGPEYKVMNGTVSGSFYMADDGTLRWSERDSCMFQKTGKTDQPYTFVEMEQGDGYIMKTADPGGEVLMVLPEGAIVGATPGDSNIYAVFGNVSGYLIYNGDVPEDKSGPESVHSEPESTYGSEVYVFWGEDVADYLEDYDEYIADDDESAAIIVFAVENDVREFSLDSIYLKEFDADDKPVFVTSESYDYGTLSPDRELAVQLLLAGSIPNYGISFRDADGVMRHQYITVSGEDGSLLLIEY